MDDEATLAIREAMSTALNNPVVREKLPSADLKLISIALLKDEAKWTEVEHARVVKTFVWAAQNC